ncbi:MAG: DUF1592 domain-containing protein [Verrucomicrobiota bacterium]
MPAVSCLPVRYRRLMLPSVLLTAFSVTVSLYGAATPAAPSWQSVLPSMKEKCFDCHGGKKTKGGVDLKRLEKDPAVLNEYSLWIKVNTAVESGDMPPDDSKALSPAEKKAMLSWVNTALEDAAQTNAGDPGPVTLRRLSNAEYDNSIRDLTGFPYRFAKDFVPDGGGGEGFSNLGDVLFTSPQQLDKYITAARKLSEHATIQPGSGIQFYAHRIGTRGPAQFKSDADAKMFVWYQKMSEPMLPKDGEDLRFADYMTACWKWKHRELTGAASLEALAKEQNLNFAFLENWWNFFQAKEPKSRFLDITRNPWNELPAPNPQEPKAVPPAVKQKIQELGENLHSWYLPAKWSVLRAQQDSDELKSQPFNTPVKGERQVHLVVGDLGDGNRGDVVIVSNLELQQKGKKGSYIEWITNQRNADRTLLDSIKDDPGKSAQKSEVEARINQAESFLNLVGKHPLGLPVEDKQIVLQAPIVLTIPLPEDATQFTASGKLDLRVPDGDFASAQWKATVGTPPDPKQIIPGLITVWKRQTASQKEIGGDFARLREVFPENMEHLLNQAASNRFRNGKPGPTVYYFSDKQLAAFLPKEESARLENMKEDWRYLWNKTIPKNLEPEWDKKVLAHLEAFANKAWKRSVTPEEKAQFETIYKAGLTQELDRESCAREVLVKILVSPSFLFKLEQVGEPGIHPVTPIELASRLSYFLWSSLPDEQLRKKAEDGSLTQPEVLKAETLRMLQNPKATALAQEFAAQWLGFKGFDEHLKVDGGRFPEFTPELRHDFYDETVTFFSHIIRNNRPVSEILTADYTFLNERLAKFYGIPGIQGDEFKQTKASDYSRGGLLAMGSVLTKLSYPHRTSPVLRGNWLIQTVFGTPTPPAPNNVPKLDDNLTTPKSLRERLERHRADKACASCHDRIDPLGFALEGFDPIGRIRKTDDAGSPVDDSASTKDGRNFRGISGLREYVKTKGPEFNAQFCRKLVGYALGRSVLPTDKALLEQMKAQLQSNDPTIAGAVLAITQSRQFQNRRGD